MPAQLSNQPNQTNFFAEEDQNINGLIKTPTKLPTTVSLRPVTPDADYTTSSTVSETSDDESSTKSTSASTKKLDEVVKKITQSEHRILEKEGKLEPEPMLIENPRRFVLFPIEHDDVSAILMLINFENLI